MNYPWDISNPSVPEQNIVLPTGSFVMHIFKNKMEVKVITSLAKNYHYLKKCPFLISSKTIYSEMGGENHLLL